MLTSSNCFTLRISLGSGTLLLVSCEGKSSENVILIQQTVKGKTSAILIELSDLSPRFKLCKLDVDINQLFHLKKKKNHDLQLSNQAKVSMMHTTR